MCTSGVVYSFDLWHQQAELVDSIKHVGHLHILVGLEQSCIAWPIRCARTHIHSTVCTSKSNSTPMAKPQNAARRTMADSTERVASKGGASCSFGHVVNDDHVV